MNWWCTPSKVNDNRPCHRPSADKYEALLLKQKKMEKENEELRQKLRDASDGEWSKNIDKFVDQWFEENRDDIDIGVIDLKFCKIDIFPDYLEKHIYKKVLKIVYSFMTASLSPKIVDEEDVN